MADANSTGARPIITYSQARKLGLPRYFQGSTCKRGHVAERRTADGMCLECERQKARDKYQANRVERSAQGKQYRAIATSKALTAERVRELLRYEPDTGAFVWRSSRKFVQAGAQAGATDNGYVRIRIEGHLVRAHRLAWLYAFGVWPEQHLDHINGIRSDNRINNLRLATPAVNAQNQRAAHTNNKSSGLLGVHRHHDGWRGGVSVDGKKVYTKTFPTAAEAQEAHISLKRSLHEGCTL